MKHRNCEALETPPTVAELEIVSQQANIGKTTYYNCQNQLVFFHQVRNIVEHGLRLIGDSAEAAMDHLITPFNVTMLSMVNLRKEFLTSLDSKVRQVCNAGELGYFVVENRESQNTSKLLMSATDVPD
jgi:hypothetical protein